MNRALMIAFHYPPFQGSSGVLRTWNFSRYLREGGWQPLVLTASSKAYGASQIAGEGGLQIPLDLPIWRASAFDAALQLSIKGRYPRLLALPDRWASWYLPAVARALLIARKHRPSVIWSTYPIASAHLVALTVHRLTGLPWIADFRDSMTEDDYPSDPWTRKAYLWIERSTIRHAQSVVFTTRGTHEMYAARYPATPQERFRIIANGYDDDDFTKGESVAAHLGRLPCTPKIRLVHSGVIYPSERDPRPFLDAVSRLRDSGRISADAIEIIFRASGHDSVIRALIDERRLADIVALMEPMPYHDALGEMLSSDGLLLFQAANCNHQIPAKLYEYFRAGKPILALTDERGDTAETLRSVGIDTIADLSSADDIVGKLAAFIDAIRSRTAPTVGREAAAGYSRRAQARELAQLLNDVARTDA